MKAALFTLLALVAAGSLAKADSLDYKYTLHIDGVVLPGDGLPLPSVTLVFLTSDDVRTGPAAEFIMNEISLNPAKPLSLSESGGRGNPYYVNPFSGSSGDYSGFGLGTGGIFFDDNVYSEGGLLPPGPSGLFMAGYDTSCCGLLPFLPNLPAPGQTTFGFIYGNSSTFPDPLGYNEWEPTRYTLRLNVVPEPSAASLLALGLIGIVGLALWRKKPERTIR